jgi:excinuclease UvrABC helicase subunit UvrB
MTTGFYARLRDSREDDALAACIDRVVKQLEDTSTSGDRPGMLLGKIQSGKTRAFVGVIARSFDRGFEMAVVFTKGTKTLSGQTVARLRHDLREFIDNGEILVFDIMQPPGKLLTQ